jgi:hypothetical protein
MESPYTPKDGSVEISLVSECDATSCKYNEHTHCTAGQIKLVVADGKAECGTYTDETE